MMQGKKIATSSGGANQIKKSAPEDYTGKDTAANDAENPAATAWGYYYQQGNAKNENWLFVSAADWPSLQKQRQPLYATALQIEGEYQPDAATAQRYRGDAYFDWDCKSADEFGYCINDVNQFLDDLQQRGVNLNCLRIYATGGRGFHIEIPWGVYSTEKADKGVQYLPHIYREMARQLFGRYLDLSIYSGRRGRMWRTCNVQRENGQYKVQISLDEMRRMTPERYVELCSAPRPALEVAEPELAVKMVSLFDTCRSRVASNERKPVRRLFKLAELPDTLADVMAGKCLKSDVGFNALALQLALAAHALDWAVDDLLDATVELRAGWLGDTHTTAEQCADELQRMFAYTADNSGYTYSPNAIRALLADTAGTDDLTGEIDLDEVAKATTPAARQDVVAALAELDALSFDACKKEVAEAMNVGATALAEAVRVERRKQSEASERAAAEAEAKKVAENRVPIVEPDAEPWPEPVDGEALLTDVAAFIRRYVFADACIIDATALWVAQTYAQDIARYMPIAHVTAPEKRCGKSTMLETIGMLAYRPLKAACISAAALTRVVQIYRPTLMLDEYDRMNKELKAELEQMINAGHSEIAARSIKLEKIADEFVPVAFNIFGPKVLSGIGNITDTTADRSIRLELARKLPGETVHSRHDDGAEYEASAMCIRSKLVRWVADNASRIRNATPKRVANMQDRMWDNWFTLCAIAETAGGAWVERAKAAARHQIKMEKAADTGGDYKLQLLRDIRDIFAEMDADRYDGIAAGDLVSMLCRDATRPWATFNNDRPLNAHRMGKILAGYGIKSDRAQKRGNVFKGANAGVKPSAYFVEDFQPAFERYLPDEEDDDGGGT